MNSAVLFTIRLQLIFKKRRLPNVSDDLKREELQTMLGSDVGVIGDLRCEASFEVLLFIGGERG